MLLSSDSTSTEKDEEQEEIMMQNERGKKIQQNQKSASLCVCKSVLLQPIEKK